MKPQIENLIGKIVTVQLKHGHFMGELEYREGYYRIYIHGRACNVAMTSFKLDDIDDIICENKIILK